ncbi:MAG TPA: DMT family transporter [Vicinamibacterales bacterium]|nr:DMT family transporter [Vicinamibacterales bacterium]
MSLLGVHSRRGAYVALAGLTLVWGFNWIVMKAALINADPLEFNMHRTWLAVFVLFAAIVARRGRFWPRNWRAVVITGLLQTTLNMGATMMAVAGGGVGRTSVLVYTMPFWTLVIAWPVLHERVKGAQRYAIVFAFAGLMLVVQPWAWQGDLGPKLWAVLSGLGWASGTVAMKYFQRERDFDMLSFMAWQMIIGVLPLTLLPWLFGVPATHWSVAQAGLLIFVGAIATAGGFLVWIEILRWLPAGTASLNLFAVPVIAILSSMAVFGERITRIEWIGIAAIGVGLCLLTLQAIAAGGKARDEVLHASGK